MKLITVPHSVCSSYHSTEQHNCDYTAQYAAEMLNRNIYDSIVLLSDINRIECDMNRIECRDTDYRRKVRKAAKDYATFVIDVHSFEPSYKKWAEYEIVFLYDNTTTPDYLYSIVKYMQDMNIKVDIWKGIGNDIQDEMIELGIPVVLIEFNEGLGNKRMEYITRIFAKAIK